MFGQPPRRDVRVVPLGVGALPFERSDLEAVHRHTCTRRPADRSCGAQVVGVQVRHGDERHVVQVPSDRGEAVPQLVETALGRPPGVDHRERAVRPLDDVDQGGVGHPEPERHREGPDARPDLLDGRQDSVAERGGPARG
ncbi:hypothetical protein Q9Q99_00460 [Curtobacterium flaccumfaciens]|nr:hypothetical protein Q9Q99_00460 [Curtobacterium flaccumfaciens]